MLVAPKLAPTTATSAIRATITTIISAKLVIVHLTLLFAKNVILMAVWSAALDTVSIFQECVLRVTIQTVTSVTIKTVFA